MASLLKKALDARSLNVKIGKELDKGNDFYETIRKYDVTPVSSSFNVKFPDKWWLKNFFEKRNISYTQGSILVYALMVLPAIISLPHVLFVATQVDLMTYFAVYIGALVIVIELNLLHFVWGGLKRLVANINENIAKKSVAPLCIIRDEQLISNKKLKQLDKDYQDYYVKPIVLKTSQLGLDLAYNKRYQLGSGAIAAGLFSFIFLLRYVFDVIPHTAFSFWAPTAEIVTFWFVFAYIIVTFLWFLTGMLAWSFFIVFLVVIQTGYNTLKIRPYESLKEYFQPITSLVLKTSFSVALVFGWFSPYMLVFSILPAESVERQASQYFVIAALVIMIPVLIMSIAFPILAIHKGMNNSRDRALRLKQISLEKLAENPLNNFDKNLRIQNHLIDDYCHIVQQPEWALDSTQVMEVLGTIFLPILTFILSQIP